MAGACLVQDTTMTTARLGAGVWSQGDQWLKRVSWRGTGLGHSGAAGLEAGPEGHLEGRQDTAGWRGPGRASEQS